MYRKVVFEEKSPNFTKLSRQEKHPEKRVRLIAMAMLKNGSKVGEAAKAVGVERRTVGQWYSRYLENGLDGLKNRPRSGRNPKLSQNNEDEFVQKVLEMQKTRTGGCITGYDIQAMAVSEFGVTYAENSIYKVLDRLGLSWITSRSKHPKADPEAQTAFKKTLNTTLPKICPKGLI